MELQGQEMQSKKTRDERALRLPLGRISLCGEILTERISLSAISEKKDRLLKTDRLRKKDFL